MLRKSSSETVNAPNNREVKGQDVKLRILKEGIFDREVKEQISKFDN